VFRGGEPEHALPGRAAFRSSGVRRFRRSPPWPFPGEQFAQAERPCVVDQVIEDAGCSDRGEVRQQVVDMSGQHLVNTSAEAWPSRQASVYCPNWSSNGIVVLVLAVLPGPQAVPSEIVARGAEDGKAEGNVEPHGWRLDRGEQVLLPRYNTPRLIRTPGAADRPEFDEPMPKDPSDEPRAQQRSRYSSSNVASIRTGASGGSSIRRALASTCSGGMRFKTWLSPHTARTGGCTP